MRRRRYSPSGPVGVCSYDDASEHAARRPVVLRCPGPLVALRGLAELYGVAAEHLEECLQRLEPGARGWVPGELRAAVSDTLGCSARPPTAVHYFHAARLRDPQLVLTHGLPASPRTPDALWRSLGAVVADMSLADWASLQPGADGRHDGAYDRLLQATDALRAGPRGSLICDVVLRPTRYGIDDRCELPAAVRELAVACRPQLGFDVAERFADATTPCVVEYRRCPSRDGRDIDVALSFVEAALRGTVSRRAIGDHDADGVAIAAHDIVSVRATGTQREWTPSGVVHAL